VSRTLYNAVTLEPHGLICSEADVSTLALARLLTSCAVPCSAEERGYLNCAFLLAALRAVTDVAHLLQVGDIVSVIDMPPKELTTWWRGKHGFQVGPSIRHDSTT